MKLLKPGILLGILALLFVLGYGACPKNSLDFNGTYLVTVAYESGNTAIGQLQLMQDKQQLEVNLVYPDSGEMLAGTGTIDGENINFHLAPATTPSSAIQANATSLDFSGTGVDANADGQIDSLNGSFMGTECQENCEDVAGSFDANEDPRAKDRLLNFSGAYDVSFTIEQDGSKIAGKLELAQQKDNSLGVKLTIPNYPTFEGKGMVDGASIDFFISAYAPNGSKEIKVSGLGLDSNGDGYADTMKGTFAGTDCGEVACNPISGDWKALRLNVTPVSLNYQGSYSIALAYTNLDRAPKQGKMAIVQASDGSIEVKMDFNDGVLLTGKGKTSADQIGFSVAYEQSDPKGLPIAYSYTFSGQGLDQDKDGYVDIIQGSFSGFECLEVCYEVDGTFTAINEIMNPADLDFSGVYTILLKTSEGNLLPGTLELGQGQDASIKAALTFDGQDYALTGSGKVSGQEIRFEVGYQQGELSVSYEFSGSGTDADQDRTIDTISGKFQGQECGIWCKPIDGAFDAVRGVETPADLNFSGDYKFTMEYASDGQDTTVKNGTLKLGQGDDNTLKVELSIDNSRQVFYGYGAVSNDRIKFTVTYEIPEAYISYSYTFAGQGADDDGDKLVDQLKGEFQGTECREVGCPSVSGIWYGSRK